MPWVTFPVLQRIDLNGLSVLQTYVCSVSWWLISICPPNVGPFGFMVAYRTIHVFDQVVYQYHHPRFTNRLSFWSMVVGKAFGLSIHLCNLKNIIITPKSLWIRPSDHHRLAYEIFRLSAFGLPTGLKSVLSIGS